MDGTRQTLWSHHTLIVLNQSNELEIFFHLIYPTLQKNITNLSNDSNHNYLIPNCSQCFELIELNSLVYGQQDTKTNRTKNT